ncbi:MAG: carbamoyl-phosphate synthase (glutamine-hydrolyzing) large subunit [Myxococcota bacterium]
MYGAYLPKKPKKVLVLGSGALQIGQAGEFDYSGSQAIKALSEERVKTVLINPNIATIQTSEGLADRIYLVAVTPEMVERVIVKEEVDAILLSFGGQTALNCGLELERRGTFQKYGVRVLGTPVKAIRDTEDRELFVKRLNEINVTTARSRACTNREEAKAAAKEIGFPVMLRSGFSLGGKGSSVARNEVELIERVDRAIMGGVTQVLVEEYLAGWKEIEYEVVRDFRDNCITVCNMENFDPMGIHTGESIVVAPSQTLTDDEYQMLRSVAIKTIRHLGIVGECNIQYALNPNGSDYRVIEVNARLSRSSALASKATGYPLAYVAAKLSLGYTLPEVPNGITRQTSAFFEPALDYIVCKFPRWDLGKFKGAALEIGTEMKSVGEVMAIGRTFPEVIQKAVRMLDIGVHGVDPGAFVGGEVKQALERPTPTRIFAIAKALHDGMSVDQIHEMTRIDRWFLHGLAAIAGMVKTLDAGEFPYDPVTLRRAKELGFSDHFIAARGKTDVNTVRTARKNAGITTSIAKIDTLAAEFPAETNYLYTSYHATEHEIAPSWRKKILVLGSGTYRIGSSVEFDWCCVNAVKAAQELGYETIMLNYNPETVSTDYDVCDQLVFDEVSFESVLDVYEREKPEGVVVSMGGQIPNNLAMKLHRAGVRILGTSATNIDRAEDRRKFSVLLDELGIEQPKWVHLTDVAESEAMVKKLGGFPVLVRPSYVLSGAAMSVAHEPVEFLRILERAKAVSQDQPVVVSAFEMHAREIEIDAVADKGELVLWAISEHVEDAGVHSGDATLMLPPQSISIPTVHEAKKIVTKLAKALDITGPFNVQMLAKNNSVRVIECNLRASRSFPFVSKVTGNNFVREATRRMLGVSGPVENRSLDLDYVACKAPMFSFSRLVGADPLLGVEMSSTGEVGCFGDDAHEALLHSLLATGFRFPKKGVLLSLGPITEKYAFVEEARALTQLGLKVFATEGTAQVLEMLKIPCTMLSKKPGEGLSAMDVIDEGRVDLVINVPREYDNLGRPDGYLIRRRSVDAGIPLITDIQLARAVVEALRRLKSDGELPLLAWDEYLSRRSLALR